MTRMIAALDTLNDKVVKSSKPMGLIQKGTSIKGSLMQEDKGETLVINGKHVVAY